MPELPDVTIYCESINRLLGGAVLEQLRIARPFVLRTVEPAPDDLAGKQLIACERLGKRLILGFEADHFVVIHLMIAGRLRWRTTGRKPAGRGTLAEFVFPSGILYLTEAGTTRRASLHITRGRDSLTQFDRGGLEPLEADQSHFAARLRSENHTLKRALTDPRLFSGIGNAYSDEILHRAMLSPLLLTSRLTDEQCGQLFNAVRETLTEWIERVRAESGDFPEKVTAFREGMAVHGRFGEPCPRCGSNVRRIRYATNETNYCAQCQTDGKPLADRALSRLLGPDWDR